MIILKNLSKTKISCFFLMIQFVVINNIELRFGYRVESRLIALCLSNDELCRRAGNTRYADRSLNAVKSVLIAATDSNKTLANDDNFGSIIELGLHIKLVPDLVHTWDCLDRIS